MTASTRAGTLDLSPNAITVLERRYLVKDDQGRPAERPEDLFWRVASTIADPDRRYGASQGGRGVGRDLLRADGDAGLDAQLPHLDERGAPLGSTVGVLRAARVRLPLEWAER